MDDLEEFNKKVKEEKESANRLAKADPNLTPEVYTTKSRMELIHARIGYDPKPLPQPSTLPH